MNATCTRHPEAVVSFTCPRCGTFACVECERRATAEGAPLCPHCWQLAAQAATAAPTGRLQSVGLVVGLVSVIPCLPLMAGSIVLNGVALLKSPREHRWKPLVGLGVTLLVAFLEVVLYKMFSPS